MIKELIDFFKKVDSHNFYSKMVEGNYSINQISNLIIKHPDKPIRELLTLNKLQKQVAGRIKKSERFIFTAKGVEQASSTVLAEYHAEKMQEYDYIADLCCGNGIDLYYTSFGKKQVWAVDLDEDTLLAAEYNNKGNEHITYLQQRAEEFAEPVDAIFIDPDRRSGNRRLIQAEDLSPGLSEILKLQTITANILVKLSPAMNYKDITLKVKHSWEFISENGELKEILLCLGDFAQPVNRAVLLPAKNIFSANKQEVEVRPIQLFLLEPDVAIIRAGLVQDLGFECAATLIESHLALLSHPNEIYSEYFKTYRVLDQMNFNRKNLQKYLREKQIGKLVIKTRGFSQSVEEFRKKLKLSGENSGLIFILRMGKGHQIVFAELMNLRK